VEAEMIDRRNLMIGAACAISAGAAYAATPRTRLSLARATPLETVLPNQFGDWVGRDIGDALALNDPESLAARLYSQIVTRQFINAQTGGQVVMLVAYGERQTDGLQLHRPEVCYPAFGYKLTRNEPFQIPLPGGMTLPARRLAAESEEAADESIVYWARIGESLPKDGQEQRRERLRIAMQGMIPDGVLVRFSAGSPEPGGAWPALTTFIVDMLRTVPRSDLPVLVGTARAKAFAAAPAAGVG
jgi:EpsI family protein